MRVLLGLAALVAAVNGAVTVTNAVGTDNGVSAPILTQSSQSTFFAASDIRVTTGAAYGTGAGTPAYVNFVDVNYNTLAFGGVNGVAPQYSATSSQGVLQKNYFFQLAFNKPTVYFQFAYNSYVSSAQYQYYAPGSTIGTPTLQGCDPCVTKQAAGNTCDSSGSVPPPPPPNSQYSSRVCASLNGRLFTVDVAVGTNTFYVFLFDYNGGNDDVLTYKFVIQRLAQQFIGDPQIVGMQGQDFQVHGMPDEIFNMVTYPNVQVNARFTYLSEAECPDNYTTCFAHPGTYISEQGFRVGKDKVHVQAGPAKKGLTVKVNGRPVTGAKTALHMGMVEIVNKRRVIVKTPIAAFTMTNSDKFMNQESDLFDSKLLRLGNERVVLRAGESYHPEVPLHGLQGQTWRNVEYPSGLDYEGSIMDYHVVSGNIYGKDFVFNKFEL